MLNKVMLIGNLGQDPELRNTAGGTAVSTIRIATNERRKNAAGDYADHVEWHTVVLWGRDAENVVKYCQKGKQLYIEGRLQTRKWQDKNGADRYSTEIVCEVVRFLGGGGGGGERTEGASRGKADQQRYDEEVPF